MFKRGIDFCSAEMQELIDYSNPIVIQNVIKLHSSLKAQAELESKEYLTVMCVDIENAIEQTKLSKRQREAINLYMLGWTEEKIGELMGNITHQAVHKLIKKACEKISNQLT